MLQYTGGTTGVSKGAVLLHRNVIANVLQSEAWNEPVMQKVPAGEQPTSVCALPLYHIFAFTVNMMLSMRTGGKLILIPNPRDIPAVLKELSKHTFHSFPAVNTLFNGLANHPDFNTVDWSNLKISVGGGMAVQGAVAKLWLEKTGCPICEGYGLSETSPSATCNPTTSTAYTGTIGVPLPSTELKLLDDDGSEVPLGQPGEIAIKGPQVMAGYWQRPDETAKVMTADGYFKTGDIGIVDERGYFKIVDRKKDMILVSGFNVYPNEIEDVVAQLPGVLECAAVGVADDKTGEAVKLVIVKKNPALTEAEVREYCQANLTGYKQPKVIEFRTELPKTPVGKILRRELRDRRSSRRTAMAAPVAIVAAMQEELGALLAAMPDEQRVRVAGRDFWVGHLQGRPVVAVLSRIGKVAAATTATVLLERFGVRAIVFTGVAGGLAPGVRVGDVVVASRLLQHDLDASPIFPRYEVPLTGHARFATDTALSDALAAWPQGCCAIRSRCWASRWSTTSGCRRRACTAAWWSAATASSRPRPRAQRCAATLPDALACEMEGAAVAQVCHDFGVPFAAVRTISDRADDQAHVDFMRFVAAVASRYSLALMNGWLAGLPGANARLLEPAALAEVPHRHQRAGDHQHHHIRVAVAQHSSSGMNLKFMP